MSAVEARDDDRANRRRHRRLHHQHAFQLHRAGEKFRQGNDAQGQDAESKGHRRDRHAWFEKGARLVEVLREIHARHNQAQRNRTGAEHVNRLRHKLRQQRHHAGQVAGHRHQQRDQDRVDQLAPALAERFSTQHEQANRPDRHLDPHAVNEQDAATLDAPDRLHDRQRQVAVVRNAHRQRERAQTRADVQADHLRQQATAVNTHRRHPEAQQRRQHEILRGAERRVARHRLENQTRVTEVDDQPDEARLCFPFDPMHPPRPHTDANDREDGDDEQEKLEIGRNGRGSAKRRVTQ